MFRKPKKGTLSKFRQTKKRSHDDDDNCNNEEDYNTQTDNQQDTAGDSDGISSNSMIATKKKFRRRSDSSSDEENSIHDTTSASASTSTNTSELLQQIKNETKKKKKTKFDKGTNSNNDQNDGNNHHKTFMNEYKSKNVLTQKELATLQAQHHPSADGTTMTNTDDSNNGNEQQQQQKITIEKEARNKFLAGPIKASKFIRTTSRFDYQPDICKDYKETGFCGYGDTCIYLHDRSNLKSGFALEQEWEEKKRKEKEEKEKQMDLFCKEVSDGVDDPSNGHHRGGDDVGVEDDGLPFACHLCRDTFQEPVVTICNHYFCQSCILIRVQENNDPSCPICNQDTNGVFNFPTKLVNKRKKLVGRNGTWEQFANFLKK